MIVRPRKSMGKNSSLNLPMLIEMIRVIAWHAVMSADPPVRLVVDERVTTSLGKVMEYKGQFIVGRRASWI